jgi:23S rRNA (guanine745-N1)-methyltransferase
MELNHDDVGTLVGMGPTAWHADPTVLADRIAALPVSIRVTASVVVAMYRLRT